MAEDKDKERQQAIFKEAVRLAAEEDSYAAFAYMESQGTGPEVINLYSELLFHLYYQEKDLPTMILFARQGIAFSLRKADQTEAENPKLASSMRRMAGVMSFNLASFTWPGWEEPGITMTPTAQAIGLDAARFNLRMNQLLDHPPIKVGNSHWIIGAQLMAKGDYDAATKKFETSCSCFQEAKSAEMEQMANGYAAIAQLAKQPSDDGEKALQAAIADLRKQDTDDSKFLADQLESVRKVFVK